LAEQEKRKELWKEQKKLLTGIGLLMEDIMRLLAHHKA